MLGRLHPAWLAFGGSVLLLFALIGALAWTTNTDGHDPGAAPLYVYCAEALRGPLEAIAQDYERDYGQKVYLHFGPSQTILASLELSGKGDLFLPADESYVRLARDKKLLADVLPLARMRAVVIVRPDYPSKITSWKDVVADGVTVGLANPEAAAVTKLVRNALEGKGRWQDLVLRRPKHLANVNDVANAVGLGSLDVGIVWDVVAHAHPKKLTTVSLPELDDVTARVQVGLTKSSAQPDAALRLARYLRATDKGPVHLREHGFTEIDEGDLMSRRPELVVYAGAMLRPVVEETLNEFERREGVRITRVYNGCGILVSQMQTGERPDVYFACDPRFMDQVKERFDAPDTVSSNQLVIAVRKGGPHALKELKDLGKPGLRVGVGHEQQCALGALTRETFLRTGVYAAVMKNVVVQSPTGDFLINQLRTGSLDAVVAYRSNVAPFPDDLVGVPITGIDCAAPHQPVAVSRQSEHPDLSRKLVEALRSPASRARFEKLGFGWEIREVPPQ